MTFLSVLYALKEVWTTWVWAILGALFYAYIYYTAGLWVSAEIQLLYLGISFYGLARWQENPESRQSKEQIKKGNAKVHSLSGLGIGLLSTGLYCLNAPSNGSPLIFYDSVLVASAIVAQYLMVKKYLSCWYLWIFVNVAYLPLFYQQQLYASLGLYVVLFYFTILGTMEWHRKLILADYDSKL